MTSPRSLRLLATGLVLAAVAAAIAAAPPAAAPTPKLQTRIDTVGETNAFKTSTGAEIRFFMPVLNVPFRLIFAMNPSRTNVLDNNLQPEKKFKFRFAVGTTF